MFLTLTVPAAVAPALALLWIFHRQDRFPEPPHVVWKTFGLGVLTVVPVLLFGLPAMLLLNASAGDSPYLLGLGTAFFGAAIPEEMFKFLVVYGYCRRHSHFDEPMDGLVYGASASLGFAALENVLYVAGGGLSVAIARACTAVPMHGTMGVIMGYYIAAAHYAPSRKPSLLALALGVPVLLHGLYDFPLLTLLNLSAAGQSPERNAVEVLLLTGLALAVLATAIGWAIALAVKVRRMQSHYGTVAGG